MRKLAWLAAVASVAVGAGPLLGGSYAPFTDLATATGSVTAGTIDLLLSDQDEPFKDNLTTHTWVLTNALPGDPEVCQSFQITNDGDNDAVTVNIKIVNTGSGGAAMAQEIIFNTFTFGATNLLPSINSVADGHAGASVRDLELDSDGITLTQTLFANKGNSNSFGACLQFHVDASNSLQGQTWLGTFTVTISS